MCDISAMRVPLTPDDIKTIQMKVHNMSSDPAFRQRFQGLNDASTAYDVLRTGQALLIGLRPLTSLLIFGVDTYMATNGSWALSQRVWETESVTDRLFNTNLYSASKEARRILGFGPCFHLPFRKRLALLYHLFSLNITDPGRSRAYSFTSRFCFVGGLSPVLFPSVQSPLVYLRIVKDFCPARMTSASAEGGACLSSSWLSADLLTCIALINASNAMSIVCISLSVPNPSCEINRTAYDLLGA